MSKFRNQSLKFTSQFFLIFAFLMIFFIGFTGESLATLSFSSDSYTFDINENSANNTLIGQVSASGGDYAYTLQLDVGTQEISNWSTRGEDFETINFSTQFSDTPIVFSQIQSYGEYNVTVTKQVSSNTWTNTWQAYEILFRTRQQNYSTTSFETILETSLQISDSVTSIDNVSGAETVGWLAISSAVNGIWGDMPFEVILTDETITDSTTSVSFSGPFTDAPQLMGSVATYNDSDQVGTGLSSLKQGKAVIFMDEFDDGSHSAEAVALLMIQGSGSLLDINGDVIGTAGTASFYDTQRDSATTVTIQKNYSNPVVFVQPVSDEFDDAAFRFTDISYNSFSGYVHGDNESNEYLQYDYEFDLQYFIFETGSWEIGVESYSYSIIDGNESGAFSIDTNTGEIEVADSSQLDYESGDIQYVLTLQVYLSV